MQYVYIVQCALLSIIRIKLHMVNIQIAIVITKHVSQLSLQLFFFSFMLCSYYCGKYIIFLMTKPRLRGWNFTQVENRSK